MNIMCKAVMRTQYIAWTSSGPQTSTTTSWFPHDESYKNEENAQFTTEMKRTTKSKGTRAQIESLMCTYMCVRVCVCLYVVRERGLW